LDFNSQDEKSLGSVRVHCLTLFCTPMSMRCDSRVSFLARTFVSLCLGYEPKVNVATLLLEEWEDDTHTPKMGTWESTETPKILEFDHKGQNTLH
jgi:hypothetical protein